MLHKKKLVISNWKMNLLIKEAKKICEELANIRNEGLDLIIAAPPLYLQTLVNEYRTLSFAAQNITHLSQDFGPYTGEISAFMSKNIGADYVIIGHSERRKYFKESEEEIKTKIKFALSYNITPIICFGETLEERASGNISDIISYKISEIIPQSIIDKEIIFAYEPIWAIGSGRIPSNQEIEEIALLVKENFSPIAKNMRLVYGGSVNQESISKISEIKELDGVLVGASSLSIDEFVKIIRAYA